MKKKNRDVNIFSMSALDLFASAMGAFMLLAVISLPFFGNTSKPVAPTKCPDPVECVCKKCPEVKTPLKPFKSADIVIVFDISGSMSTQLNFLKAETKGIAHLLKELSSSSSIRYIAFGDDGFDQPVTAFPLTSVNSPKTLQGYVDTIKIDMGVGSGGNNISGEAVYAGVNKAINTRWNAGTDIQSIVLITDDEPHPGQSQRLSREIQSFASSKNRRFSVLFTGSSTSRKNYYQNLASIGNGTLTDLKTTSLTAGIVLSLHQK